MAVLENQNRNTFSGKPFSYLFLGVEDKTRIVL